MEPNGVPRPAGTDQFFERTRGVIEKFVDVDFPRNEVLLQRVFNDHLQRRTASIETERQKVDRACRTRGKNDADF